MPLISCRTPPPRFKNFKACLLRAFSLGGAAARRRIGPTFRQTVFGYLLDAQEGWSDGSNCRRIHGSQWLTQGTSPGLLLTIYDFMLIILKASLIFDAYFPVNLIHGS